MKSISKSEWALLAFIVFYSLIPAIGGVLRLLELAGGPAILPANARALSDPFPIALHITSSFLFLIAGAFQFMTSFRRHYRAAYRANGRILVIAGMASAASGLWMTHIYAFPENLQGNLLYSVRMDLGSLMIGFIVWAVIAIKSRNIYQHSAAMLRAYAIGQGASTQAMLGIGWIVIVGSEAMGPVREGIMVSAWGLNLLVAEVLVKSVLKAKAR